MDLQDLNDVHFRQLVEDLWQKATTWEGIAPAMGSPFDQWWVPMGEAAADLEQWDVTFHGGGEGRGPSELPQWPSGPLE